MEWESEVNNHTPDPMLITRLASQGSHTHSAEIARCLYTANNDWWKYGSKHSTLDRAPQLEISAFHDFCTYPSTYNNTSAGVLRT